MNADLRKERDGCTFNPRELTFVLDGSRSLTERREELQLLVEQDPEFDNSRNYFLTREERYQSSMRKFLHLQKLQQRLKLNQHDIHTMWRVCGDELGPTIHALAFVPNIRALFSKEQQAHWLPLAERHAILGCYAQTELGHGSNVRGLETTATYLPHTDEFDIHSPTLTSTKWWPGLLGRGANHAIVYAQLVIGGRNFGVHNFMVPIRSLEDHSVLPNIEVGDIGPKIGFAAQDHGYCRFTHVRIPRTHMAMRFAVVDKGGRYWRRAADNNKRADNPKVVYFGMVFLRAAIVASAKHQLSIACTIAIRYSAVRRQGGGEPPNESQVLDFPMQQYRLFPLLACSYALHFTGRGMIAAFAALNHGLEHGDLSALQEVHATSSGLKALCTRLCADGMEECRKCCGGHGYLLASGLPERIGTYLQSCTVEGENYMITQQCTRFLLKMVDVAKKGGDLPPACHYLVAAPPCASPHLPDKTAARDMNFLIGAYEQRARHLVHLTDKHIHQRLSEQRSAQDAWNDTHVLIHRASHAHCMLVMVKAFHDGVEQLRKQGKTDALVRVMGQLCQLFALHGLLTEAGEFMESGWLLGGHVALVREAHGEVMREIRPNAVGLVDAFGHADHALQSALGRYDGQVYQALWDSAQANPFNHEEPVKGWRDFILPYQQASL